MLSLLNPTLWLVALAILAGSSGLSYFKGRTNGMQVCEARHAAATVLANDEARKLEQARQRRADEAAKLGAAREARIRASAASAARAAGGLRDDLRTARDYAAQSRAAAERVARVSTELLGECSAAYLDMAEAADRSDSYARQLIEAWPR
jgi:hypothetical protein